MIIMRLFVEMPSLMLMAIVVILGLSSSSSAAFAFAPSSPPLSAAYVQSILVSGRRQLSPSSSLLKSAAADDDDDDGWISLTDDDAVRKRILEEADEGSETPTSGQTVEIDYVGTLGKIDWDVDGVINCWLLTQQGLDGLVDGFRQADLTSQKLMEPDFFTEDFVATTLGLSNKIQIKKLVMASKRLTKTVTENETGTQFDSNKDRNDGAPYSFVLGKNKSIQAMEIAVASMKVGERAEIVCRTDYAYGKEGLRKANGDVLVPEFATLCFDIKLLNCT